MQDGRFHAAQARPRHQAQLLGQHPVSVLVGGQGLGLSAGPVQGEHELFPEPLMQRVSSDQTLDLTDKRGVAAQGEVGIDPPFHGSHLHGLKPSHLGLGEGIIVALAQYRATARASARRAESTTLLAKRLSRRAVVGHRQHPLETIGVHLAVERPQLIAGRLPLDTLAARPAGPPRPACCEAGRHRRAASSWRLMAGPAATAHR